MKFEAVIGLEIHAELQTESKMFCGCPVVDATIAEPNTAACPICSGMPGVLPVANQRAVAYAIRVALALNCEIAPISIFARKNYFYPDLPKGYQISQYEQPLARNGVLVIQTSQGERSIRVRRVHLEEDTGKLTHVDKQGERYTLVDLNRAGVPLLEIVSEPDLHSAEEVRSYAETLRSILRYLRVNMGDMQKGVMRIEPNVSVRPVGASQFGTRTEIKNLNSFRALERSVDYEIRRQSKLLRDGLQVEQETRGWDEGREVTFVQRSKEEAHDYRYFPEPDLPPLEVSLEWINDTQSEMPELPGAKRKRYIDQFQLSSYDADVLTAEPDIAAYFEQTVQLVPGVSPKVVANWITGELFGLLNQAEAGADIQTVSPLVLADLVQMVTAQEINQNTAKKVLAEIFETGKSARQIVDERGYRQISDVSFISDLVIQVLQENKEAVETYLSGKESVSRWLFGQVMRAAKGQADPGVVQQELNNQLSKTRKDQL